LKAHLSRLYRALTFFYIAFPVTFLVALSILFVIPGVELTKILLQPSYYLLSIGGIVTGLGLWDARRWSWYAMRAMSLAMAYSSVVLLVHYGETPQPIPAFFGCIFLIWLLDRAISSELRVPYFMPQISWWESNPRYQIRFPVRVTGARGEVLEGQILDLSLDGCFIKMRPEIQEQTEVTVECELFGKFWASPGVVVWQTFGAVTFPRGLGIKFRPLEKQSRRALKAATIRTRRLDALYRRGRFLMTEEELKKNIDKLKAPIVPPNPQLPESKE
jgi:hypothetical protein